MMHRLLLASCAAIFATSVAAQEMLFFPTETFGNVVLPNNQSALGSIELEASVGNYNNEFVWTYGADSIFAKTGRAVGRLDILTDKGHTPCTAFLVSGNRLITNHHCVPGILDNVKWGATSIVAVNFVAGYLQDGITESTKSFHVNPKPIETNRELDYSVLQVLGNANAEFGALRLASALPSDRAPFWVIGHPMGEAQRISREKCQASVPAVSNMRLLHTCDTLPGNSGSPVIDAGLQEVIGLHHAGSRAGSTNFAIPMAMILEASEVLEASMVPAVSSSFELEAALALGEALTHTEVDMQNAALLEILKYYPDTQAAVRARNLANRANIDPDLGSTVKPVLKAAVTSSRKVSVGTVSTQITPPKDINEEMARSAFVQSCERLAGDPLHPDRAAGFMKEAGVAFEAMDVSAAVSACRRALLAFPDHPRLLTFLGRSLTARKSFEAAATAYRGAADAGDALAMTSLGFAYQNGDGVFRSEKGAVSWFRKAALDGFGPAQVELALIYKTGRGVSPSSEEAAYWFKKAADQGFGVAQYELAGLYEVGQGVSKDANLAASLYIEALRGGIDPGDRNWDGNTARALQRELRELGLYAGAIDGDIGPGTLAAMRKLLP